MTRTICAVAIDTAVYTLDKLYDYTVPEAYANLAQVGCRVRVPFGKGNARVEGVILSIRPEGYTSAFRLKPLDQVLDETPILSAEQIQLGIWMRERLFCTFYACLRQMLPTGLWLQVRETYVLADPLACPPDFSAGKQVLACFTAEESEITYERLQISAPDACTHANLQKLIACGALQVQTEVRSRAKSKTEKAYALATEASDIMAQLLRKNQAVHRDVVSLLADGQCMTQKEIIYMTGASTGILHTMCKKGWLCEQSVEQLRLPDVGEITPLTMTNLNPAQQQAYESLSALQHQPTSNIALLFGVTGSGKTQVYLHLIADVLAQGKSAILLLPEIGLTPQFIRFFMGHFGEQVAVLHSALSVGERFDSWNRIRRGEARVVIGTRSAVFAPAQNLGLLIIDEEQDSAYKSEQAPRYHAREVAQFRTRKSKALLLLGSATPSVETYYAGTQGKFPIIPLTERYGGTALPQVMLANRKGDISLGYAGMIGSQLHDQIRDTLSRGEQVILFLNRRGNSRVITCNLCGWVATCPNCSAPMTYHSHTKRLHCHYCGSSEAFDGTCPDCAGHAMHTQSAGTQRVEEELQEWFPDARILRMDTDSTLAKNAHTKLLDTFSSGKADILLGTQMVAKGLDFDHVTLVGVLDADQMLFAQDYRATERAFSLLTQVVGRAGRRQSIGRAVIQTYCPEHSVLLQAARQDYPRFYEQEIERRGALCCPPHAQLLYLLAVGLEEDQVMQSLLRLRERLLGLLDDVFADLQCQVIGPTPANVVRVANKFRYYLVLRCADTKRRRQLIAGVMQEFLLDKKNTGVSLIADRNLDMI